MSRHERPPHYSHRMSPRRHEESRGHSERFPWDEPNFDPDRVLADLGNRLPWEDVPEDLREHFTDDMDAPRRSPRRSPGPRHRRHDDLSPGDFHRHHRPSPPHHHEPRYDDRRRPSPKHPREREGRGGGRRGRGGGGGEFREELERFEEREIPPLHSPRRMSRERMPSEGHHHHHEDHNRDPSGWEGREERPMRGRGRGPNSGRGRRGGRGRGRDPHGPFEDGRREEPHRDRSPHSERYEREPDFRERLHSLERGGPGERGGEPLNHPDGPEYGPPGHRDRDHREREPPPQYFEERREPPTEYFEERRERGTGPNRGGHFKKPNMREEGRAGHHPIAGRNPDPVMPAARTMSPMHHEGRGESPVYHERSPKGMPPTDHRDRGAEAPRGRGGYRGRGNSNGRGRGRIDAGPPRNQPRPQPYPQGGRPHSPQQQHPRQNVRPREPDWDAVDVVAWKQEESQGKVPRWENDRPRGRGRGRGHPPRGRMNPGMSRDGQREQHAHWDEMESDSAMREGPCAGPASEETLTIKVDMSRRVGQNSQHAYSSDRQLSLDLVNVGRQRLDFLPMLEHSGTYRENTMHSGTFAQEIITLVHKVKDHYFKGDSVTLNQRFSGPQEGGEEEDDELEQFDEDEVGEDGRPTLNRRFNMNMRMMVGEGRPFFSNQGQQGHHMRGLMDNTAPGDLRHDLERRRQERLEEVKITIPGSGNLSQRPLGPGMDQMDDYGMEPEDMPLEDDLPFSDWPEQDQGRRWDGPMGQRRGGFRGNMAGQRRNFRPHRGNRGNMNGQGANW